MTEPPQRAPGMGLISDDGRTPRRKTDFWRTVGEWSMEGDSIPRGLLRWETDKLDVVKKPRPGLDLRKSLGYPHLRMELVHYKMVLRQRQL